MEDKDIEYGADCLIGWDTGKTPKYIYGRFAEVVKCADEPPRVYHVPPNDRVFKLTQDSIAPCVYNFDSATWDVNFMISDAPDRTVVTLIEQDPYRLYFSSDTAQIYEEGIVLANDYVACEPNLAGHLGIAVFTWTPQATDILAAVNLAKGYDLFMELRPTADGKLVYKFCRLQDATNIKILFEP